MTVPCPSVATFTVGLAVFAVAMTSRPQASVSVSGVGATALPTQATVAEPFCGMVRVGGAMT